MSSDFLDIDPSVQQALREMMQSDYHLLVETYLADAQRRLSDLRQAFNTQNWDAFRQSAHSFRGSCGNMGAVALESACREAERAGLERDAASAADALADLERLHQRMLPLMHARLAS